MATLLSLPGRFVPLSILDYIRIEDTGDVPQALREAREVAQKAESWGYHRVWYAEHHNDPHKASSANAVVIAHIASVTSRIRVGAGGVMLRLHSPLVVAEQFGTLDALFPDRIDLGLGRGQGCDDATARLLQRGIIPDPACFDEDVGALRGFLGPAEREPGVRAIPGSNSKVALWILGTSEAGARLAGELGLPFSFGAHTLPRQLLTALSTYHKAFRPSASLARPYVMVGINVLAADSDERASYLAGPNREQLDATTAFIGSPDTISSGLNDFVARTGVDELVVAAPFLRPKNRLRSYQLLAALCQRAVPPLHSGMATPASA